MNVNWQDLSINGITNLFLYGQWETPPDLGSAALINHDPVEVVITNVDSFMLSGPGVYANASQSSIVSAFMEGTLIIPDTGVDQELTLTDIFITYGLTSDFTILQPAFDLGASDFDLRGYVYGHSHFAISDSAKFIVKADGTRYIENLAVIPKPDNFDYITEPGLVQIYDKLLFENKIDPSGIGETVTIKFNDASISTYVSANKDVKYTFDDYNAELNLKASLEDKVVGLAKISADSFFIASDLFSSGVTAFLDAEKKPILYGSDGNDVITGATSRTGVDISAFTHPLSNWVKNGISYFGGAGNDIINGTGYNDKIFGGDDNDTLVGNKGNDYLEGGQGFDYYIYNSGDGFDAIVDTDGSVSRMDKRERIHQRPARMRYRLSTLQPFRPDSTIPALLMISTHPCPPPLPILPNVPMPKPSPKPPSS